MYHHLHSHSSDHISCLRTNKELNMKGSSYHRTPCSLLCGRIRCFFGMFHISLQLARGGGSYYCDSLFPFQNLRGFVVIRVPWDGIYTICNIFICISHTSKLTQQFNADGDVSGLWHVDIVLIRQHGPGASVGATWANVVASSEPPQQDEADPNVVSGALGVKLSVQKTSENVVFFGLSPVFEPKLNL